MPSNDLTPAPPEALAAPAPTTADPTAPDVPAAPDFRAMVETIADTLFPLRPEGGGGDGGGGGGGDPDAEPDVVPDLDGPDPDWRVGPRRPPRQHRFVKGRSGNPHGRPRRNPRPTAPGPAADPVVAPPATALEKAVSRRVEVELGGRRRRLGLTQAVIGRLIEKGLEGGDLVALRELLRVCADAETARARRLARAAEAEAGRGAGAFRWTGRTFGPEDEAADQLMKTFGALLDAEVEAAREGVGE